MIVYHGSSQLVKKPDVCHSYRALDFGKGFYVTSVREQAERWAKRKAGYLGSEKGIVSVYELESYDQSLRYKTFGDDLGSWIDFVCRCRDGNDDYLDFDVVIGKVANDKVFRVVDMYHSGIWDKQRALQEIRVYPTYDQIAFITQKAIDKLLTYKESYEVSKWTRMYSRESIRKIWMNGLLTVFQKK